MRNQIKYNISIITIFIFLISCNKSKSKIENSATEKNIVDLQKKKSLITSQKNTILYKKFTGAWFDIEYPANFLAKGFLSSESSTSVLEASFTSPDGKVEFYVFSPQWSGKPNNISLKQNEIQTSNTREQKKDVEIKRWTISAKDKSYNRSYEEVIDKVSHTNKIFGIKSLSKTDLKKYNEAYLHFKKSLVQYAD